MELIKLWLKLRGRRLYEDFWKCQANKRLIFLLDMHQVPWIPSKDSRFILVCGDFDDDIIGNWKSLKDELEIMFDSIKKGCDVWQSKTQSKIERIIIDNIRASVYGWSLNEPLE